MSNEQKEREAFEQWYLKQFGVATCWKDGEELINLASVGCRNMWLTWKASRQYTANPLHEEIVRLRFALNQIAHPESYITVDINPRDIAKEAVAIKPRTHESKAVGFDEAVGIALNGYKGWYYATANVRESMEEAIKALAAAGIIKLSSPNSTKKPPEYKCSACGDTGKISWTDYSNGQGLDIEREDDCDKCDKEQTK